MEHSTSSSTASSTQTPRLAPRLMLGLMEYKVWADVELLQIVAAHPELLATPDGGFVTAIVRHYHTVDCIFQAHLRGVSHSFTSTNPAEPATLAELEPCVQAVDAWYVEYARTLGERELQEVLSVTFTDGQEQRLTRADILLHVSLHGTYHRGNVGLLLRKCGIETPPDRLTSYLNL